MHRARRERPRDPQLNKGQAAVQQADAQEAPRRVVSNVDSEMVTVSKAGATRAKSTSRLKDVVVDVKRAKSSEPEIWYPVANGMASADTHAG